MTVTFIPGSLTVQAKGPAAEEVSAPAGAGAPPQAPVAQAAAQGAAPHQPPPAEGARAMKTPAFCPACCLLLCG